MRKIAAILADADGTLIEKGRLDNFPLELKQIIRKVRASGVLFSLASGRPLFEQELLHKLLIEPDAPKDNEGILYESSRLKLFGRTEKYILGGLNSEQISEIRAYFASGNLIEGLIPQSNNERYETQIGYVTSTFISHGKTNHALLEQRFKEVKPVIESRFQYAEVSMSADAIDVFARGMTKAKPAMKYAQLVEISPEHIAAIGDSSNDISMLDVIGNAGGLVVYVGTNPEQEEAVKKHDWHFIPHKRGPSGTINAVQYILHSNSLRMG